MKLLWTKDLLMNTVHVTDVVMAAWHVAGLSEPSGTVYNLADKGNSSEFYLAVWCISGVQLLTHLDLWLSIVRYWDIIM